MMLTIALICLVSYIGICIAAWWFQEKLLYFPPPVSLYHGLANKQFQQTLTLRDGCLVTGWIVPPTTPCDKLVVYFGGNAEDVAHHVQTCQQWGNARYAFFNYPGFAGTLGHPNERTIFSQSLLITQELQYKFNIQANATYVIGRSLGSGVACYIASVLPINKLVLLTPYNNMQTLASLHFPYFPKQLLSRNKYSSEKYALQQQTNALFIAARDDQVVPNSSSQRLFDIWKGPKKLVILDQCNHINITEHTQFGLEIKNFIDDAV